MGDSPEVLRRRLEVLEATYRRQVRFALMRMQRSVYDPKGLARPPEHIRAVAAQVRERLDVLLVKAYQSGTRLGRADAYAQLDKLHIPRPRLPALRNLPESIALGQAMVDLDARFNEALEELLLYPGEPNQAMYTLKMSAYAATSTAANSAYTDQSIEVFKSVRDRKVALSEEEKRDEEPKMLFGFLFRELVIHVIAEIVPRWTFHRRRVEEPWKRWVIEHGASVHGNFACVDCVRMDGQEVEIDDFFGGPSHAYGPPMHPNCRCRLEFFFKTKHKWAWGWTVGGLDLPGGEE